MKQSPLSVRDRKGIKPQLGKGVFIEPAAVVCGDVIIGAGTLVPPGKTLEIGFLYFGSPCCKARLSWNKSEQYGHASLFLDRQRRDDRHAEGS